VNLRSLAFRAYIANVKELTLDVLLPAQIARQYEAVQGDSDRDSSFRRTYRFMEYVERNGLQAHLVIAKYRAEDSTGTIQDAGQGAPAQFTISGDRLIARVSGFAGEMCNYDFRPSSDMTLHGTMSCEAMGDTYFPKLGLTARIF